MTFFLYFITAFTVFQYTDFTVTDWQFYVLVCSPAIGVLMGIDIGKKVDKT